MVDKALLKTLRVAQKRIEARWCQGGYDMRNGAVCAVGALQKITGKVLRDNENDNDAYRILKKLVRGKSFDSIEEWNDEYGRKKQEVICLFQEAIEEVIRG